MSNLSWIVIEGIDGKNVGVKTDEIVWFGIAERKFKPPTQERGLAKEKILYIRINTNEDVLEIKTDLENVLPFAEALNRGFKHFKASQENWERVSDHLLLLESAKIKDQLAEMGIEE